MHGPLDATPDTYAQRVFLRGLRRAGLDRFALLALIKAQHLLGLVLAHRLVDMRASTDALPATLAQAEAGALLAHVLREALEILGARLDKLPERRRPQYTPPQRFRILMLKNLAALSQPETAKIFCVSIGTIARWEAVANPASQTVGATVIPMPPVRRYNDTVHHLVQTIARLGFGGSRSLAQHLARAGWTLSKTTVARYLEERPVLDPQPNGSRLPETPKRAVRARFPHHVWHLDLTEIQAFFRAGSFSLAVVLDSASRLPLSWKVFERRPSAHAMIALVESAFARHGTPRHLIVDKDGAFTAHAFRERVAARRVTVRYCSAQNHRANSRIERFWRALKYDLLRLRAPAEVLARSDLEHDVERALRYYALQRPHQGLGGATPAELYFGLEPAHLRAVQPPRGRRGDPPARCAIAVEYADGDHRFPFLRHAA